MLPSRASDLLNSFIDLLTEYGCKRGSINDLHKQLLQTKYARLKEGSEERTLAEAMYACFLRDFDLCDAYIAAEFDHKWSDHPYLANFQTVMLRSFRFRDFLRHVRENLEVYIGEPSYLQYIHNMSVGFGFFQLAEDIATRLDRLKVKTLVDRELGREMFNVMERCQLKDDEVAEFLECGLKAFRNRLKGDVDLFYIPKVEHLYEELPEMLVHSVYVASTYDDVGHVQDHSLEDLSDRLFSPAVSKHLVISFRAMGNEVQEGPESTDEAAAVS